MTSLEDPSTFLALALTVFGTSALSGVLGMGGGIILMGVLATVLPVPEAMMLHGAAQLTANAMRATLQRRHILLSTLRWYGIGAGIGFWVLASFHFESNKRTIFFLMGVFPLVQLAVPHLRSLSIIRKPHAIACGFVITALQIVAGASGPVLDMFFAKREIPKHAVVATKAATQVIGHLSKIIFYASIAGGGGAERYTISENLSIGFAVAIAMAILGTFIGNRLMESLSEEKFQRASRLMILLIGCVYIVLALKGPIF